MTSRADDIHKLIIDIDNLLSNSSSPLSKLLSGQSQEEKGLLQQIRNFLIGLNESELSSPDIPQLPTSEPLSYELARFAQSEVSNPLGATLGTPPGQSDSIPEKLPGEFSALLQPLRVELADLLAQRASLIQEIRQLEQRRLQNYSLTQQLVNQEQMISEFLQVLMSRLLPSLSPHLANSLNLTIGESANKNEATLGTHPFFGSSEQMERLVMLARELDQRLLSLDGTVNLVFDALQRNIKTYHQSLSQALARMHSQGLQGEQLMTTFLDNLTQYLQQQSWTELSSSSSSDSQQVLTETSLSLGQLADAAETSNIESLDEILLQLTSEQATSLDIHIGTNQLQLDQLDQLDQSRPVNDEVDQLYASLFGTEDILDSHTVKNDLLTSEIITPLLKIPEPEKNHLDQQINQINPPLQEQSIPNSMDMLPETKDFAPLSWEDLFLVEDTQPPSTVVVSDVVPVQIDSLPSSDDTITVLTDLLIDIDINGDERSLEIPFLADTPETASATIPAVSSLAGTTEKEEELFLDSYIPASPQEDLLSLQSHESLAVKEIVLDIAQRQQLELDLANFDRQLTPSSEYLTNQNNSQQLPDFQIKAEVKTQESPEIPAITPLSLDPPHENQEENIINNNIIFENQPVVAVRSPDITQTPIKIDLRKIIEKKKEATIPTNPLAEEVLSANSDLDNSLDNHPEMVSSPTNSVWYLGIDLGTTGISAALLNRSTSVVYPIYWSTENQPNKTPFPRSFRLPAEVYLPMASTPQSGTDTGEHAQAPNSTLQDHIAGSVGTTSEPTHNLYSAQLKPYLQVAVPYKSKKQKWEPVLQLNDFSAGPLIWVVRSLSKLLLTLKSDQVTTTPAIRAAAVGLDVTNFSTIINNISGIICNCPSNWSEQYRFNLREAILTSLLVKHPEEIFFVEEAIATLLPELTNTNHIVQLSANEGLRPLKTSEHPLMGNTLAINIGANSTEMALVDLLANGEPLTHKDFMLHGFAYAGKGIEQDIICQLLLPPKSRQSRLEAEKTDQTTSNTWHWQPTIPGLDQMYLSTLELETLELPKVGEPDMRVRVRLQQRLESSLLGHALLDAALALKIILQHQESFTLELADQRWVLQRRDLESQVFVPFVRRLNRELNKLLVARGIPTEAINQAVLTGGLASVGTINRWLKQKLPNAKIIQDTYLDESGAPTCSRVAYGLAVLPIYSQVLEVSKQQYTDYFLLGELLKILPDRSISFGEVLQLFENRGVNTRTCQQRLLAFLEGELPAGLIPSSLETTWLTVNSQDNPDYNMIPNTPLCEKLGNLTYRPNFQQLVSLRYFMDAIKTSALQSLDEPYTVNLDFGANVAPVSE